MLLREILSPSFRRRSRLNADYRAMYGTPEGERVLHDLLRESHLLETSAEPGDPYKTHFEDGRRSMGLLVLDRLGWGPSQLVKLNEREINARLQSADEEE